MATEIEKIDFFRYERQYNHEYARVMNSDKISAHNKRRIDAYMNQCLAGLYGKKLAWGSAFEQLNKIKIIAELTKKDFDNLVTEDFDKIIIAIDRDIKKGGWVKNKVVIHCKKFMRWLRLKYWYPAGYPEKTALDGMKFMLIQNFQKPKPDMNPPEVAGLHAEVPADTINGPDKPTFEEIGQAWDDVYNVTTHSRDRCKIAMIREKGNRIGGIGGLRGGDIVEIDAGFKAVLRDKNQESVLAEPQFMESAGDILAWIKERRILLSSMGISPGDFDKHPFFLNLRSDTPEAMSYIAWRKLLKRLKEKHNKKFNGQPDRQITKRLYAHLARYYNEGMDQLNGTPDNVRRKERGWSPRSGMPGKYGSKIESKNVEKWYQERGGTEKNKKTNEPITCWKCNKVNEPTRDESGNLIEPKFCFNCATPISRAGTVELQQTAMKLDARLKKLEQADRLMGKLIEEIELTDTEVLENTRESGIARQLYEDMPTQSAQEIAGQPDSRRKLAQRYLELVGSYNAD